MADPAVELAPGADKAATADDGGAAVHVPTADDIKNFRCDCLIDKVMEGGWLALWRLILGILESAVEVTGCCIRGDKLNCLWSYGFDLRLTVRIWGISSIISGVQGVLMAIDWISLSFIWGIYWLGNYAALLWMGYLLWMGGSFNDADKIAIALNIQGWLITLSIGMGLFFVLTTEGVDFGWWIQNAIIGSLVNAFLTSHIVKYLDIIDGKVESSDLLDPVAKKAEWDADAAELHFTGCCCGGAGGGSGTGTDSV